MDQIRTQVVVAGAGPVGAVAAFYLAQAGIDVVLLEAGHDCALDLRASTFHPPTLEMLDTLGITDRLLEMGLKAPVYQFRERRTGEAIEFDMGELADVTRHPYRVQCEQYHLSRMLSQAVTAHANAEVRFHHRLVSFEQNRAGVEVFAEGPTSILSIRTDYLIAADGANSIVRKWLGTEFDGFTYPEKFLCFTTSEPLEEHLRGLCYVNYVSDPDEWMVLLKVPSLWRVLVPARDDQPDEELLGDARKNDVFRRLIGEGERVLTPHRTIYRVHQRVAQEFVHGRVILIGDAAHLNNPIGGFGMNSGIHDAFNLCDKLVRIYRERGDADRLLGHFQRQRHSTTHEFIQAQTIRNMQYLTQGAASEHDIRRREMEDLRADPVRRRAYLLRQSMIASIEREKELA